MFIVTVDDDVDDADEPEEAENGGDAAPGFPGSALQHQLEIVSNEMCGWSELPKDILGLIAERLLFLPDLNRFASVCVAWRLIAMEKRHLVTHQPPLLMVSYEEDTETCNFFCLTDMEFYKHRLPELKQKWCCGSSNGWLITLDDAMSLSLVNPFSRAQIQLPLHPSLDTLRFGNVSREDLCFWMHEFVHKVVLSDNPTTNPTCLVMAFVSDMSKFSMIRLGDETWTIFETAPCQDATYYEGGLYASFMYNGGANFDADADSNLDSERVQITDVPNGSLEMEEMRYFINYSGELLHVIRYWELIFVDEGEEQQQQPPHHVVNGEVEGSTGDDIHNHNYNGSGGGGDDENNDNDAFSDETDYITPYYKTAAFQVFKLDKAKEGSPDRWIELKSLGDQALFLGGGHSLCFSVANSSPNCKSNCIYFMDDNRVCLTTMPWCTDMGVYNMVDGSIEPFPISVSWSCLPLWLTQNK